MNSKSYDIIVAKEYNTTQSGQPERKTAWNRVGRAWKSKSGDFLNFELFLIPNQIYVLKGREATDNAAPQLEEAPF